MTRLVLLAAALAATAAPAADLTKLDRSIRREPAYATTSPRYAVMVFGPAAKDRVWLVKDGDTLYVDRNGNGDLTDPGEKIAPHNSGSADDGCSWEIDEITVGGTKHYNLNVSARPLRFWLFGEHAKREDLKAAARKDPQAETLSISLEATLPYVQPAGRVFVVAGPIDLDGPLLLAAKPAEAPVIHVGGPLEITFSTDRPTLRRGNSRELVFAVGSRGVGPGTFARINYEKTIPGDANPVGQFTFPPAKAGGEPIQKRFEFKERC
jgi:hypothetical protein